MTHTRGALGLAAGLALAWAAGAIGAAHAAGDEPAFFSVGVGYYDIVQQDDQAADFRLEYRHDRGLWWIKPWIGVEATSDGALYGVGGFLVDVPVTDHWAITPSLGVGGYSQGDGRDLGHAIEFRSQIEVAYRFENRSRLGLAFSHISNASIGDRNPGTEILNLYYHLPLTALFGD